MLPSHALAEFVRQIASAVRPSTMILRSSHGVIVSCMLAFLIPLVSAEETSTSLSVQTFDEVWSTIHDSYYDPTFGGLDWVALRETYRPQALEAKTPDKLRPILNELLGKLGESHFGVIPGSADLEETALIDAPESMENAEDTAAPNEPSEEATTPSEEESNAPSGDYSGIHLRLLGADVIVSRVMEDSPAAKAGVRAGQRVLRIGNLDIATFLKKSSEAASKSFSQTYFVLSVLGELTGHSTEDASQTITVVNPKGSRKPLTLRYFPTQYPGKMSVEIANMPSMPIRFEAKRLPLPQGDVLYISFNIFLPELMGQLRQAILERGDDVVGLMVDVRGNPGGIGMMANGLAGLLTDEQYSLGQMTMRSGQINFVAFPQQDAYLGPIAILVDGMSASTSELFAAGLQESGRARVFGRPSMGAALPSYIKLLPNGDRLQHAIADMRTARGRRIEGRGVIPDEKVPLRPKKLFLGQDPTVDKALKWLQREAMP